MLGMPARGRLPDLEGPRWALVGWWELQCCGLSHLSTTCSLAHAWSPPRGRCHAVILPRMGRLTCHAMAKRNGDDAPLRLHPQMRMALPHVA